MKNLFIIFVCFTIVNIFGQTPNYPFPNYTVYVGSHITPNNYTQTELNNQVKSFYDDWKQVYLKNDCGNTNEYYVFTGNGAKNVSEGQGYGMMITAYLAGYDTDSKIYFDGLYNFFKSHPSYINPNLMDWQQVTCNDTPSSDDDAASDGDIDIAFALLLAHLQWGSTGTINYLSEAQTIINAIMQDEINQETWSVKLGDWADASEPNYYYGTRPSDFITDHFSVFACFDNNWNTVIDTCYTLIENMQQNYSPSTGLIPDFIINVNTNPNPAGANYLEDVTDGDYYYNACRVPWRLGTDYLINNETRAKTAINNINSWLQIASGGNVNNISNGYNLDGTAMYNWNDATFIGPFTVAAMADISNQTWLNNLYQELVENNDIADGDYYSNTLKLLSMIVISGNYWTPHCNQLGIVNSNADNNSFKIYPNSTRGVFNLIYNQTINKDIIYRITDVKGNLLLKNRLIYNHQVIDITSFKTGMYFVSIITDNRVITRKIIKE